MRPERYRDTGRSRNRLIFYFMAFSVGSACADVAHKADAMNKLRASVR